MTIRYQRYRMAPPVATVLGELGESATGLDLSARLKTLVERGPSPSGDSLQFVLKAYLWLLERAAEPTGIPLTDAGWMKPAVVKEFAPALPEMEQWIFGVGREADVYPIAHFRERLQSMRLLRKYKSSLRLTKAGKSAVDNPGELWRFLAEQLLPVGDLYDTSLAVVLLLHAATDDELDKHEVARVMTELGWQHDGGPVTERQIYPVWNSMFTIYGNVGRHPRPPKHARTPPPAATMLIRDALLIELPG